MWTKEKAYAMAYNRYRNSYIPDKFKIDLKFESIFDM